MQPGSPLAETLLPPASHLEPGGLQGLWVTVCPLTGLHTWNKPCDPPSMACPTPASCLSVGSCFTLPCSYSHAQNWHEPTALPHPMAQSCLPECLCLSLVLPVCTSTCSKGFLGYLNPSHCCMKMLACSLPALPAAAGHAGWVAALLSY